jgi:hypothetical protein
MKLLTACGYSLLDDVQLSRPSTHSPPTLRTCEGRGTALYTDSIYSTFGAIDLI